MNRHLKHPILPLDPSAVTTVDDTLRAMGGCSFQARQLSMAVDVLEAVVQDEDAVSVLALSGAMVPAGMGLVIERLMERGVVDVLVTTGANLSHDLVDAACRGKGHFKGDPEADDDELYQERINRIYDTNLPEAHYAMAERLLLEIWTDELGDARGCSEDPIVLPPSEVFRRTGAALQAKGYRGILATAAKMKVPVFCGATTDSEFCLNLAKARHRNLFHLVLDEMADLFRFGNRIKATPRRAALIVGGGVPRNWAQQIFPLLDMTEDGHFPGYDYGVRICTDNPVYGGLSGCTLSESKSWGKYAPHAQYAEVSCDATIALPLIVTSLLQRLDINSE